MKKRGLSSVAATAVRAGGIGADPLDDFIMLRWVRRLVDTLRCMYMHICRWHRLVFRNHTNVIDSSPDLTENATFKETGDLTTILILVIIAPFSLIARW